MAGKTKTGWSLVKDNIRWGDLILVGLVILLIGSSYKHRSRSTTGSNIYVYKDNVLIGIYPATQERKLRIDEHNSLQIKDGKVRMLSADCPDKRCVKQGWTSALPIICLPNHLVIEIKQSETERKLILQ